MGCYALWDFGRTQRSAPAGVQRAESPPGRTPLPLHKGALSRQRAGAADDIRLCGRATQGVRLMRVAEGSRIVAVARAEKEEPEEETEE